MAIKKVIVIAEEDLDQHTIGVTEENKVRSSFVLTDETCIKGNSLLFRKTDNCNALMVCTGYFNGKYWVGDRPGDGEWFNPFDNKYYRRTNGKDVEFVPEPEHTIHTISNVVVDESTIEPKFDLSSTTGYYYYYGYTNVPSSVSFQVNYNEDGSNYSRTITTEEFDSVRDYNAKYAGTEGSFDAGNGLEVKFTYPTLPTHDAVVKFGVKVDEGSSSFFWYINGDTVRSDTWIKMTAGIEVAAEVDGVSKTEYINANTSLRSDVDFYEVFGTADVTNITVDYINDVEFVDGYTPLNWWGDVSTGSEIITE